MGLAAALRALTGLVISTVLAPLLVRLKAVTKPLLVGSAGVAAIVAGFAWTIADRSLLVTFASVRGIEIPWDRFIRGMDLQYFFVMAAWITGYLALVLIAHNQSQRETLLRQNVEMQEIRLNLLAAQLNPHFLFNSLNTIRSLAAEDPMRTREVVSRLSSFLRRVMNVNPSVAVPLSDEIELARDYLDVEKARFEDGLEVDIQVDEAASRIMVPPLILQPLLENAIKHGEAVDGVRAVSLVAEAAKGSVVISVRNHGSLAGEADGTGLRLTRERLEQSFRDRHRFELAETGNRVTASITLPLAAGQ